MQKILFVYHSSEIGGGSYCLLNLLRSLNREEFNPIVLLPQIGPLCKEIEKLNIAIYYLPGLTTVPYNTSLFRYSSLRRIILIRKIQPQYIRILDEIEPDIVYLNSMMLYPFLETSKSKGIKTVIHVREHWNKGEHPYQRQKAINSISQYADSIIAINQYSASLFLSVKEKVSVVYDWIDMEMRRGGPSINDIIKDKGIHTRVYLFTGGLQPVKGTLEVIQSFINNIHGEDRKLLLLGLNPVLVWNGWRGKIQQLLSLLGIKNYREKVVRLCKSDSRIVCYPSIYEITDLMEEVDAYISFFTIPHANLALAESIIMNLPSLAAETPEAIEYSQGSELAHLFEFGDLAGFIDGWKTIDKSVIKRGGSDSASLRVRELFDTQRNAAVFNNVLLDL